jgi:hypothetical protein
MAREFDPYRQWLGLRPEEDLNHYRLLDIKLFEESAAVIQAAADRRKMQVDAFRTGEHAPSAEPLFERISVAATCLLESEQKAAYDAGLRHEFRVSANRARRRRRQMASVVIPIGISVLLIVLYRSSFNRDPTGSAPRSDRRHRVARRAPRWVAVKRQRKMCHPQPRAL